MPSARAAARRQAENRTKESDPPHRGRGGTRRPLGHGSQLRGPRRFGLSSAPRFGPWSAERSNPTAASSRGRGATEPFLA
jgi:hypothetical protein